MNKETRNQIKNIVLYIRRQLEIDVSDQLEGTYGISRVGEAQRLTTMPTLQEDPTLFHQRRQIDLALQYDCDTGLSLKEAIARFIHETAYTSLNRLVAIKTLEARGLLKRKAVAEGQRSDGFKDFQKICPQVCQARRDGGYQLFLELLFDELAFSIRPLFDLRGAHSIIFPSWKTLDQMIALLNDTKLATIWDNDETIGWIYQYFNTSDRDLVRARGRPQSPKDVAVINQFYTPRYVVEFLVDNTLGRLWLEMRQGKTELVESCRTLVVSPIQIIRQRDQKDPREIKILDPAVGSGHFLHYAFDVLTVIYEECGYDPGEIPSLILENNLFGIDIDARAVQLAAFSLYLRARAYEQDHKAESRVRLPTANIVVAEAMPGDKQLFEEFVAGQSEVVRNVCQNVWKILTLASQVGSLLRVEVILHEAIESEQNRLAQAPLLDIEFLLNNDEFWEELQMHIVNLFHDYFRRALTQSDLGRVLFASEGEQGFRFLDLLGQDYDVVLMNPPYGDTTETAKAYLRAAYPDTENDLYAAFIERALVFLRSTGGYVGAITNRTFLVLDSYRKLRENVIFNQASMGCVADLGSGVLDNALVETVAFTLRKD